MSRILSMLFGNNPNRNAKYRSWTGNSSDAKWSHECTPESCCWRAGYDKAMRHTGKLLGTQGCVKLESLGYFKLEDINEAVFRVTGAGVEQLAAIGDYLRRGGIHNEET